MTETRRCAHCSDPLPEGADPRRRYHRGGCQEAARNDHRREVTAWKRRKAEIDSRRAVEQRGQLSLDPRPLDDLLPTVPPMPSRQSGVAS